MKLGAAVLLTWCFLVANGHAEEVQFSTTHESLRLNDPLHLPYPAGRSYGIGSAIGPDGTQIQIMHSLSDTARAGAYGREVELLSTDPGRAQARLASLILLSQFGAPDMLNFGNLMASSTDPMATVAGVNIVMSQMNNGHISRVRGTIAFDGHVHSGRSHDGADSYEAIILQAVERGLDAVAITDHNEFDHIRAAAELSRLKAEGRAPADFLLVPGEEVSTLDGHILAYFIEHRVEPGMTAEATIRAIHAQGGLAVAAHPLAKGGVGLALARELPFDGIEARGGASIFPVDLLREIRAAKGDWGDRFLLASSDAHASQGVGLFFTRVSVEEVSLRGLREGLRKRHAEPVAENRLFTEYAAILNSRVVYTFFWPVVTYLDFKARALGLLAEWLQVDKVEAVSNWEYATLRMFGIAYIPVESLRLARGTSDLQRPFEWRTIAVSKGPLRFSYERAAPFSTLVNDIDPLDEEPPTWKVEAKLDF